MFANAKNGKGTGNKNRVDKPWFTKDCMVKRREYHKAKNVYSKYKSDDNRTNLKVKSKEYNRELRKNYQKYRDTLENDLKNANKRDPKMFWNILNNIGKTKSETPIDLPIEEIYTYFKDLNFNKDETDDDLFCDCNNAIYDDLLNSEITREEIEFSVRNLKNNKASGIDYILNEYIKSTLDICLPIYHSLFNLILNTGVVPKSWTVGIIKPLYKNKGDSTNLDNYRAITLVSCLGKLFTSVINNRLTKFSDEIHLISDAQAGFRKGYSTTDNIFILNALVSLYLSFGKKLYCAFVDFRKAFDSVSRSCLWRKVQRSHITGKIFNVMHNLYRSSKSCVRNGDEMSEFFNSNIGVKQGENLSPFLFALFLNDLEDFLSDNNVNDLKDMSRLSREHIGMYLKLLLLLYADDTVIFAETAKELQHALDVFQSYCNLWKLTVNLDKTQVLVFAKRKRKEKFKFLLYQRELEITDTYPYLGILFNCNGKYNKTQTKLVDQAQKALFSIYTKIKNVSLSIDVQFKLFDALVSPILLYSSEVWGYENANVLEKVHLQFCRKILKLRKSTPKYMVYGETGRMPLQITIKTKMIMFWHKLISCREKLSSQMYTLIFKLHEKGIVEVNWLMTIRNILNQIGLSYIWQQQETCIPEAGWLKMEIRRRLSDNFIQQWYSDIENSTKGTFYKLIKSQHNLENYLLRLLPKDRYTICKFRTSNHNLPIETGRWMGINREDRICSLCDSGIGDEFHYLFICKNIEVTGIREKFIPKYYYENPNIIKMEKMFKFCNKKLLVNVSCFIERLSKLFTL